MTMKNGMIRKIESIDFHRNGVSGESFYVVKFKSSINETMLAIVFETSKHIAVFDYDRLKDGITAFGENSFRGDVYENELRQMIANFG